MFTGIIQEMGEVVRVEQAGGMVRLSLLAGELAASAVTGDSISVNGVCLTIASIDKTANISPGGLMRFDLSGETLRSTNLGELRNGDRVNLEPALKASNRLGGHLVTGHIDGVGRIKYKKRLDKTTEVAISAPPEIMRYLVKKGSIAVDGISLTVVELYDGYFTIVIIPHTEKVTTIGFKGVNDTVNLETDIIGKYVERFISPNRHRYSDEGMLKTLKDSGYM